jgi:mono/diheme cytochrome c family protein
MRTAFGAALAGVLLAGLTSCGKEDPNSPGVEFMPDMYRSPSLEYYQVHLIDGDTLLNAKKPVAGTVARGYIPYTYPNTPEGYEAAGTSLKSPLDRANQAQWEAEGEILYGKYCVHCHGASGGGDGKVGQKLPGAPPAYSGVLKDLPEGKIYHSIYWGKGLMGPHYNMVNDEERWKLVAYVQKLQGKGTDQAAAADTTASKAAPTATTGTTESKVSKESK